ncbi:unnamed protein product [Mesocestoides corti]|nr:unnamed protein product [Mesocestoides corti]
MRFWQFRLLVSANTPSTAAAGSTANWCYLDNHQLQSIGRLVNPLFGTNENGQDGEPQKRNFSVAPVCNYDNAIVCRTTRHTSAAWADNL